MTLFNKSRYEGLWDNGVKHGQGTYKFDDASSYVGQWRNDQKHGKGLYTFSDGTIFFFNVFEIGRTNAREHYISPSPFPLPLPPLGL